MAIKVAYMPQRWLPNGVITHGQCRASETVTVPGTTTGAALENEVIIILSTEAAAVVFATGSTPDAAASLQTTLTTAGMGLEPLFSLLLYPNRGDKINIKAFV